MKAHVNDDKKIAMLLEGIEKLVFETLCSGNIDLLYEIIPNDNCSENHGNEYNECLRVTLDEYDFIDAFFKKHKFDMKNNEFFDLIQKKEVMNVKVSVKDKNIYVTNYDQTKLLEPSNIVSGIQNILRTKKYNGCRAFVRPSGTEDILRLYVENNSLNSIDLNELVSQLKNILY